jgi:hypothetical protein
VPASSLDTRAWMDRGMPAPDRPWTAKDYAAASATLRSLPASAYPRAGDTTSNLFARFVATENLDLVRNTKLPLDTRMQEVLDMMATSRQLSGLYMTAVAQGAPLRKETLALMALHVDEATSMLDVLEAFMKTLDPKDPKHATRIQGLVKVEDGMAEMAMGSIIVLTERSAYETADLVEFARTITPTLPKTVSRLAPANRTEALSKLEDARHGASDPELAAAIGALAKAVEAEPAHPVEDLGRSPAGEP